jgi:hypothetical protein
MFVVKNSKGEIVAICSRKEDAEAMADTDLDDEDYTAERTVMFITFQGYKLSRKQQDMISSAIKHSLDYLVTNRMRDSLEIHVLIEKDLYKEKLIWGDMDLDDEGRSPKTFYIRLNYSGVQSFGKLLKVLCHEIVHVYQFATRRMRRLSGPFRVGFTNKHYSSDRIDYYDCPWEIEAHALENEIYEYVRKKDDKIQKYVEEKACDSWRPGSTFLADEL